ncbi:hypothetical protein SARC_17014, partial [Sphaeroforma arctica JP610]
MLIRLNGVEYSVYNVTDKYEQLRAMQQAAYAQMDERVSTSDLSTDDSSGTQHSKFGDDDAQAKLDRAAEEFVAG